MASKLGSEITSNLATSPALRLTVVWPSFPNVWIHNELVIRLALSQGNREASPATCLLRDGHLCGWESKVGANSTFHCLFKGNRTVVVQSTFLSESAISPQSTTNDPSHPEYFAATSRALYQTLETIVSSHSRTWTNSLASWLALLFAPNSENFSTLLSLVKPIGHLRIKQPTGFTFHTVGSF